MKKFTLILLTVFLFSCAKSDDSKNDARLLGKWKLFEQLSDPGDGSGVFVEINSDRVMEFFSDGTVIVNGELCYMSSVVGDSNSGTYFKITGNENYDGEIIPNDCNLERVYYLLKRTNLILWFPCVEPCGQKFTKI